MQSQNCKNEEDKYKAMNVCLCNIWTNAGQKNCTWGCFINGGGSLLRCAGDCAQGQGKLVGKCDPMPESCSSP
ncbi:hypothetical protein CF336_g6720 [Tilletia laevis]|nr:hypothetical protein CF336_g6720 [Tilletia laevis]KAE8189352.1 hypothetical protein CF335_g6647 [Tilletia laevis]